MYDLTIINKRGGNYIDSREVAEVIGKAHRHLLRDIRGYIEIIQSTGQPNFGQSDFFLESTYLNVQNKEMPCYLVSKMGCELIANKLTGEKGVLFTAAYVSKFNEMENAAFTDLVTSFDKLKDDYFELEATVLNKLLELPPTPRLGEINACARLTVRTMRNAKMKPESILTFLKDIYEPYGILINADDALNKSEMYTATQIAEVLGIYSLSGKPHNQAVACILNENIFISNDHKTTITEDFGTHTGVSTRYDGYAVQAVADWLDVYGYPDEIYGFDRTYHIVYKINPMSSRSFAH